MTPVITVVTDLVDIHSTWICGGVDSILTPLSQQAKHLVRMGVPADRVHSLGLSVDRAFTLPPCGPEAKAELRRRLGLARERVCVLVCGGADGSGKLDATARAIVDAGVDAELVVVCGRNQNVRDGLMGLRHADGRAVHVRGFVNNMADFMHAADVIVTKAGPATISEALCCGLPMLITWYVPGQERGNVAWVVEAGAGRYVARPDELVKSLKALLVPGSQAIRDMSEAAQSAARPLAAGAVGEFIARSARAADFQVEEDHVSGSLPSGRERLCARPDYRSAL